MPRSSQNSHFLAINYLCPVKQLLGASTIGFSICVYLHSTPHLKHAGQWQCLIFLSPQTKKTYRGRFASDVQFVVHQQMILLQRHEMEEWSKYLNSPSQIGCRINCLYFIRAFCSLAALCWLGGFFLWRWFCMTLWFGEVSMQNTLSDGSIKHHSEDAILLRNDFK